MTEQELRSVFENRRPMLAAMGSWVTAHVLGCLLRELGSDVALKKFLQITPSPRVKETDSFLEKALVRKKKDNPLEEITDQVGVRFVVLLLKDIERVGRIVEQGPWIASKDRDFQIERLERADYFAYQSDHYVIRTKAEETVGDLVIPPGVPCEIQIRTILQHAYAEMAHSSAYKPPIRLPDSDQKHINRALAKGSALIETTDDVFCDIKARLDSYSEGVDALLAKSSQLYESLTGAAAPPRSHLGEAIVQEYREMLGDVTPSELERWVTANQWIGEALKEKRLESLFFRDAVVLVLAFLVSRNEITVPKLWPFNSQYLEELYTMMGVSTSGALLITRQANQSPLPTLISRRTRPDRTGPAEQLAPVNRVNSAAVTRLAAMFADLPAAVNAGEPSGRGRFGEAIFSLCRLMRRLTGSLEPGCGRAGDS